MCRSDTSMAVSPLCPSWGHFLLSAYSLLCFRKILLETSKSPADTPVDNNHNETKYLGLSLT